MSKTKRKTKVQREAEQRAALLQRIEDIYSGACGRDMSTDDDAYACPEELSRVMPAVKGCFGDVLRIQYVYGLHNLGEWESPQKAAEFLFRNGFRADEEWIEEAPTDD